jgi:hypothetical protein
MAKLIRLARTTLTLFHFTLMSRSLNIMCSRSPVSEVTTPAAAAFDTHFLMWRSAIPGHRNVALRGVLPARGRYGPILMSGGCTILGPIRVVVVTRTK